MPGLMKHTRKKGPGRKPVHKQNPAGTKVQRECAEKVATKRGRRGI